MKFPAWLNPLRRTKFHWLLPFTWRAIEWIATNAPITLEVFLHHRFGGRSGLLLAKGFILLLAILLLTDICRPRVSLLPGFVLAYSVLSIAHWLSRADQQQRIHSYSSGEPWPFWHNVSIQFSTIQRFIEPLLASCAGLVLLLVDNRLGAWLLFAAMSLFIREQWRWHQIRTRQWDALDSRANANTFGPPNRTEDETFEEVRPAPPRTRP